MGPGRAEAHGRLIHAARHFVVIARYCPSQATGSDATGTDSGSRWKGRSFHRGGLQVARLPRPGERLSAQS